jgi:hypothetical protein
MRDSVIRVGAALAALLGAAMPACGSGAGTTAGGDASTNDLPDGGSCPATEAGTAGCGTETPILAAGQDTGFATCASGIIHRRAKTQCPNLLVAPPPGSCTAAGSAYCRADADCAGKGPNARCIADPAPTYCSCVSGCTTDADCGAGQICQCGTKIGQCVSARCASDADCGAGLLCATVSEVSATTSPCDGPTTFVCQTPRDTCFTNADCPHCGLSYSSCVVGASGERACSALCAHGAVGRPFLVGSEARVAQTERRIWTRRSATAVAQLTAEAREELALVWTQIGQMEHASVAAFARFALELMALGAPPRLLAWTQRAMGEELDHAERAFGLASRYARAPVGPGPLDMQGALGAVTRKSVLATLLREGCIGETLAAVEAAEALAQARDPAVREALEVIVRDETSHAALAWRTVAWLLEEGGEDLRAWFGAEAARAIAEAEASAPAGPRRAQDAVLAAHGILPAHERAAIRRAALATLVVARIGRRAAGSRAPPRRAFRGRAGHGWHNLPRSVSPESLEIPARRAGTRPARHAPMRRGLWTVGAFALLACGSQAGDAASGGDGGGVDGASGGDGGALDGATLGESSTPQCVAPGQAQAICGGQCGNGTRSTCSFGSGPAITEECDGQDLGGATCASIGYAAGGTLGCSSTCNFDTGGCTTCASGAQIGACAVPAADVRDAGAIALATTATEIVVAWTSCASGVHAARFGADLAKIAETVVDPSPGRAVALARSGSGFVIAAEVDGGLHVLALDASLAPRGPARTLPGGADPILVARGASPTDGPLLMWTENKRSPQGDNAPVNAAILEDDGTEHAPRAIAFASTIEAPQGSGVFVGDGFLLAQREWPGTVAASGVAVVRIGLDGKVGAKQTPVPRETEYPQLAFTGSEARLVYNDFGSNGGVAWARLDPTGVALGAPVLLSGSASGTYRRSPTIALGSDSVVLLGSKQGLEAWALALVRVSSSGAPVGTPASVGHDNPAAYALAPFGADAVVAWLGDRYPRRLTLARVHP